MIDPAVGLAFMAIGAFGATVAEWLNTYDARPSPPALSSFLITVIIAGLMAITWAVNHLRIV